MRVVRVRYKERVFYATLEGNQVRCLNKDLGLNEPLPLDQVLIMPPVAPSKIICAGLNFHAHALEMDKAVPDEPVLFFKPPSAIIGAWQSIILPAQSTRVDYEGELAVVMGKVCRHVSEDQAAEYIFGYTCSNDVTARDLQAKDGLYARAKGFDTFAPVGPWIETELADPSDVTIVTRLNGEVRQEGSSADMIFSPLELVSFVSSVMTLLPGDVILTGTPPGIGPMSPGDEVQVEISGVALLINPVIAEEDSVPVHGVIQ
jgi:2-keto-4-pentenoate hydratase/2-oxohepta-3-ene-1,7-dioic acid hydratase in catechol pathway